MTEHTDRIGASAKANFDLESYKGSFLMFGIGMLLPWNAMLAAMAFFISSFPAYKPSFELLVAVSVPMLLV